MSAMAQTSIYTNHSFESGATGWAQSPYWTTLGTRTVVTGASDAADGNSYARITSTSNGDQVAWEPSSYTLLPGCTYNMTFKYRTSNANVIPVFGQGYGGTAVSGNTASQWFYLDHTAYPPNPGSPIATNTWLTQSNTFTTTPNDYYTYWQGPYFGATAWNNAGTAYVDYDDIRLTLLVKPNPVSHLITSNTVNSIYDYSNTGCRIKWNSMAQDTSSTVLLNAGVAPGLEARLSLGRWWTITSTGGTFSAQPIFPYTDAELSANGLTVSTLKLVKQVGNGPWIDIPRTINTTAKTITATTAQTSFSNWSLAGPAPAAADEWQLYD